MNYREWALEELGLAGPELRSQLEKWKREKDPASALVQAVKRRGRILLGQYHPDKQNGSEEAVRRFIALNDILQTIDKMPLPSLPPEEPRIQHSVNFYPERSPYGGTIETATVRKSYFDYQTEVTTTTGVKYDAQKVVRMRPRSK